MSRHDVELLDVREHALRVDGVSGVDLGSTLPVFDQDVLFGEFGFIPRCRGRDLRREHVEAVQELLQQLRAFELRQLGLGGQLAARVGHLHGEALREILVGPESGDEDLALGALPCDDLGDDGPDRLRRDRLVAQLLVRVDRLAEYGQEVAHRGWHVLGVELQELFEDRRAVRADPALRRHPPRPQVACEWESREWGAHGDHVYGRIRSDLVIQCPAPPSEEVDRAAATAQFALSLACKAPPPHDRTRCVRTDEVAALIHGSDSARSARTRSTNASALPYRVSA